jgi:hypothetical protein
LAVDRSTHCDHDRPVPTSAIFPTAPMRAAMYESFYLRAVSSEEPLGIWIRHTVNKRAGQRPKGSVWCTVFDARSGRPFMHKLTTEKLGVPPGGWIDVHDSRLTPREAEGSCGEARWSLRFAAEEPELRHLRWAWLYRARVPRTKLTSPLPAARFDGVLELPGRSPIELRGWRGMVGHNWGSEHAERWIWLHGVGFEEMPEAWMDVALGRVKVARRTSPWVANGALSFEGRRHRLGGLGARGLGVSEAAEGAYLRLPGERGLVVDARVVVPRETAAGWRYADTRGAGPETAAGGHDVINCSIAELTLTVSAPGLGAARTLSTGHGGAYELGVRERDHGIPIAPFPDG